MLTYLAMADRFKPKWLVWENVPGVLSSNGGRDFGTFIGALGKIGYGFSWRILDAQYFGVPQRRRRVFVVGCFGDWRSAASVLFEPESMSGNPAPSREERQKVAPTVTVGPPFSRTGNSRVEADALVTTAFASKQVSLNTADEVALTLMASDYKEPQAVTYAMPGNWIGRKPENGGNQVEPFVELSPCQTATDVHAVAVTEKQQWPAEVASTLDAHYGDKMGYENQHINSGAPLFVRGKATTVRRMTPRECERLQGFKDDYTQIPWRGKEPKDCPNGHRYKAMGNSMAVPVMRWIGERIQMVEEEKL
jgi:DNA (cytosine-5)-methyltransferase 1